MRELFLGLKSLEKINLSGLNTKNVKSMKEMFKGCTSLKELD
jgi:surface protein